MKKIILNDSVYNLCSDYDFLKITLIRLGARKLNDFFYFNIVCKRIEIEKFLSNNNISIEKLNESLKNHDYVVVPKNVINIDRIKCLKSILLNLNKTKDYKKARNDLVTNLDAVECYELEIAIDELLNEGTSVDEMRKTFTLRMSALNSIIKDKPDSLSDETKKILVFINTINANIKNKCKKILANNNLNERLKMLETLYFEITKYYVFKENFLLKQIKNAGKNGSFKIVSAFDKTILDLIKTQIEESSELNKGLTSIFEKIYYRIISMIFNDENILIYLIDIFVRKKIISKINKKIENKNKI